MLLDRVREGGAAGEDRVQQGTFAHRAGDLADDHRRLCEDDGHLGDAELPEDLDRVAHGLDRVRVDERRQVPGLGASTFSRSNGCYTDAAFSAARSSPPPRCCCCACVVVGLTVSFSLIAPVNKNVDIIIDC